MPAAIEFIQNHPLYGAAAGLLLLFLFLSLAKKLVGLALVAVLGLIGYGYYLQVRGEEERVPSFERVKEQVKEKLEDAAEKAKERAKEALEKK